MQLTQCCNSSHCDEKRRFSPYAAGSCSNTLISNRKEPGLEHRYCCPRIHEGRRQVKTFLGLRLFFLRLVNNKCVLSVLLCLASFWRYTLLLLGSASQSALYRLCFSDRILLAIKINCTVASVSHATFSSLSCYCVRQNEIALKERTRPTIL